MNIPVGSYAFNISDEPANQLYNAVLSFGFGWFAAPFYFFKIFQLHSGEIPIRIFSLVWLSFTLLSIYLLTIPITKQFVTKKNILYFTILFYLFNAVALWYHVQCYVHETAVLPFYFLAWYFFAKYILEGNKLKHLLITAALIFTGIQFDWLPFFQAGIMSIYLLFNYKKLHHRAAFIAPALGAFAGIA